MDTLKSENVAVNMLLFKLFGFHRLLDPNRSKSSFNLLGYNVYRLFVIVIVSMSLVIFIVTFFNMLAQIRNNAINDFELMQLIFVYTVILRIVLIASTFRFNAEKVWKSFDVTRIDFLSARYCRKYVLVLWKYCGTSNIISSCFILVGIFDVIIWCMFPFMFTSDSLDIADHCKENILNLLFPVTTRFYNDYYQIFYVIETLIIIQTFYFFSIFIVYFLSFSFVFIAQYEIIALAYGDVGYEGGCDALQIDRGKVLSKYRFYDPFLNILY